MKIIDEGRSTRRRVADAVEILRSYSNFSVNIRPTVCIHPLKLPSGDIPFLAQLVCEELGWAVSLPTSTRFRARCAHEPTASKVGEWDIQHLAGAIVEMVESQTHVVLADGRRMNGVELIPYRMPPHDDCPRDVKSMKMQEAVIRHLVRMCEAEDRCYRYLKTVFDQDSDKDLLPGIWVLDFSMLRVIELPPLSKVMHYIQLNDAELNDISRQTVANILRDWGLRLPPSRSRLNRPSNV